MISTVERLSPAQVKLHIEVDAGAFDEAARQAYMKQRGRVNIPGFRRGKAPRKLIESMYGPHIFLDDAINSLLPEAYGQSIVEHNLTPIDEPRPTIVKAEPGGPLLLTMDVAVYPEATVGDLNGISVERLSDSVDDDAVDQQIESAREQNARVTEVEDRPVQDDDLATIDYKGTVDGEPFEGGEAEKEQLTIGSGSFVAGFEDQLIGMRPGEERDIDITFPDDYFQEDLRGKKAVFHIKLHAIHTRELPELDDEFAKDVSEFDTLEEYKADMRAEMEKQAKRYADVQYETDLVEALVERTVTEAPEVMVKDEAERALGRRAMQLMGDKSEQVKAFMNLLRQNEAVMESCREDAKKRVLAQLAINALIERENLRYSEEDDKELFEQAIQEIALDEGAPEDEVRGRVASSQQETSAVSGYVERRKAIRYLSNIARGIIEPAPGKPDSSEAAAAEPSASEPVPNEPGPQE
ncbi:MAG: trigger factor [Oscillospiraceae bacterium]|jgi:trigger factor|nr:trigger factor [Oscillospiraceae bacterium]